MVTDLDYYLDPQLIKKIEVMIKRCETNKTKKDALLINEGAEGEGKTNSSCAEAYLIKYSTGRQIHLFFRLKTMIDYSKNNERKICIWDEPSLDSLSTDQQNKLNKNLIRLLMTVRIKRHFFIFNLTKFFKFSEYIVVDRCLGLIHMYSRKEIEPGRFVYIRRRNLEKLYTTYHASKRRLYKKLKSFRGSFPDILETKFNLMDITVHGIDRVIEHCTLADYELEKNKAISMIGEEEKVNKDLIKLKTLKYRCSLLKPPINNRHEIAKTLGISLRTLENWQHQSPDKEKDSETLEKEGFEADDETNI